MSGSDVHQEALDELLNIIHSSNFSDWNNGSPNSQSPDEGLEETGDMRIPRLSTSPAIEGDAEIVSGRILILILIFSFLLSYLIFHEMSSFLECLS